MNIKRNISKLMSGLLCFSMIFSNVLPAYAADPVITENTLDGEDLSVNERNLEDITVTYKQASSFFVTIPKTIVLDGWKQSTYAVKVSGDIDAEQCVYVAPVDGIADTENIDFYMKDQASENAKDDVVASVTHNKFHWNATEVAEGHKQDDNLVSAPDLTAGAWRGIFQMEIKLETHVTHKHNYVETITKEPTCTETGEKTYTCDCGDSYTEEIPAKGHHYGDDDKCTDCGELNPDHEHSYTETITKEPTCAETGEKTLTCICGDSYIEVMPINSGNHNYSAIFTTDIEATCITTGSKSKHCTRCGAKSEVTSIATLGHSYNTGVVTKEATVNSAGIKTYTCTRCGNVYTETIPKKQPIGSVAPNTAYSNWNYALDDTNDVITLNYYKGAETDVTVYANYPVNGKTYKTKLNSNADNTTNSIPYMFNANAKTDCKNIKSIKFSEDIDTSNVTNMSYMFNACNSLTSLDISGFNTNNVGSTRGMFQDCKSLAELDVSNFDTSNVTDMAAMFNRCSSLTELDVSNFDTGKVASMWIMFQGCSSLSDLDVSNFDTREVTTMKGMFNSCSSLKTLDVSNFNTSKVTTMYQMFLNCASLKTLNVSSLDTGNVKDMGGMFQECRSLEELDVSNFNTNNVEIMHWMFARCDSLISLDLRNFNTDNVIDMNTMFSDCLSLKSIDLSSFNTSKVENMQLIFYNTPKLATIYATRGKWNTSLAASTYSEYNGTSYIGTRGMFSYCGTSSVTYK